VAAAELGASATTWLEREFDELVVIDTAAGSPRATNRRVKLSLRRQITGDFVYVDSDFLFVRPPDASLDRVEHVGAVRDFPDGDLSNGQLPSYLREVCESAGWPYPPPNYWNSGFVVWRDTPRAHALANRWSELYEIARELTDDRDQPAFAIADLEHALVESLPWQYNAPVNANAKFARGAIAWHYWTSLRDHGPQARSVMDAMTDHMLCDAGSVSAVYRRALTTRYPWIDSRGFMSYVAAGAYRSAVGELPRALRRFIRAQY